MAGKDDRLAFLQENRGLAADGNGLQKAFLEFQQNHQNWAGFLRFLQDDSNVAFFPHFPGAALAPSEPFE